MNFLRFSHGFHPRPTFSLMKKLEGIVAEDFKSKGVSPDNLKCLIAKIHGIPNKSYNVP